MSVDGAARATQPHGPPDVVVVGAITRDLDPTDPRGWRLGGGVSYGALALARMGACVGALLGADHDAAGARELAALREAGIDLRIVPLQRGPVFENEETPRGRVQLLHQAADLIPSASIPAAWRSTPAWLLAPVAGEIGDDWAAAPAPGSIVALGWQGLLRHLVAGEHVHPVPPAPSPLVSRADILSVSREDLDADLPIDGLLALLHDDAMLLLTRGGAGGLVFWHDAAGRRHIRRYPSVPARLVDSTGAGDTFLSGVLLARLGAGGRPGGATRVRMRGNDLRLGAAAAALLVEGVGLEAVPGRDAIAERVAGSLGGREGT
jgi:sugar/nucleoside kinase (ribokinase family)